MDFLFHFMPKDPLKCYTLGLQAASTAWQDELLNLKILFVKVFVFL